MRASQRTIASSSSRITAGWARDERRKKKLVKKFPGRVVARSGMNADSLIESFLCEVRADKERTVDARDFVTGDKKKITLPSAIRCGTMSYNKDGAPGIKHIPFPWSEELDKIDAQLKRISTRRRAILAEAWDVGIPVSWEKAEEITDASQETSK